MTDETETTEQLAQSVASGGDHTERDPRVLRDGDSIEDVAEAVQDLERFVEDLDELMLEVLERLERLEHRVGELEDDEPTRTDAKVIDPQETTATGVGRLYGTGGPK